MAPGQPNRNTQKVGRQDLVRKHERTRSQGLKKEQLQPPRRSACLRPSQERTVSKNTNIEPKLPLPSPTSNTPGKRAGERKRKRPQEPEGPPSLAPLEFGRKAFTDDQLEKLKPFVGDVPDTFTYYFMATWQMHFPFLTCEVKCGATALDIADRQNAHSMTLAVRGTVELFRLAKREKELHREILAFSISHDHETVRIYGHYPVINGNKTTFYRHPIRKFDFTELKGREKWTAYRFTKSVYSIWMPTHLKRICSVIDTLPNFEISQQPEPGESGLSQVLESHSLSEPSNHDASSLLEEADSQSSRIEDVTPETSMSQRIEGKAFKKPKKRPRPELH